MKVIFFLPESTSVLERFQGLVELVNSQAEAVVTRTIDDLTHNLRQPKHDLAFVVFFTCSKQELLNIIDLSGLLKDVRIIIVLPDRDTDTIRMGHKLYPRFLTDIEDKSNTLELVINKMLDNLNPDRET